jgi:predicted GNAT family acetyltransferase
MTAGGPGSVSPVLRGKAFGCLRDTGAMTAGENTTNDRADAVVVTHDARDRTYEARLDGTVVGTLIYEVEGPRIILTHTIVEPSVRRHGVGTTLVRETLEDLRRDGKTITILCPFVTDFIAHNPGYADLVDAEHPGHPTRK